MEVELKGQNKSYVHSKWQLQQSLRNKTLSQPRSQGSPLPALLSCSVGRVGENPGNEVDPKHG